MCNKACINFGQLNIKQQEVQGKNVIEVGAFDVNGSLRSLIEGMNPESYLGVDIVEGPGVDEICSAEDLLDRYGKESFDLVISTEMIEHVREWRKVVSNMKNLLRPSGALLITTRSKGFRLHGHPYDFWRYEVSDANTIFSDLVIDSVEADPVEPGIFVKARKGEIFKECDLAHHELYSIVKAKRCKDVYDFEVNMFNRLWKFRSFLKNILKGLKKLVREK